MLFELYEDMVQILQKLKVLFKQNSEIVLSSASSGSEPSLFFCN